MALEVRIRKQLSEFTLDVEFTAEQGIFSLFGASGCGKSMTLKCIAGIEKPDEGRIALDGRVLFDSRSRVSLPPQKRKVGYMFQDYALFPNMTVRKNVMAGMGKNPDPAMTQRLLERFRIDEIADRLPGGLSGGQKQRTALARIIAQSPDVILLDEPLSALDSHLRWQLEREMKETLAGAGVPVILVSHSSEEVYRLADSVCCVNRGKVVTASPAETFFRQPVSRYAAELIGCRNIAPARPEGSHMVRIPSWDLCADAGDRNPAEIRFAGIMPQKLSQRRGDGTDLAVRIRDPKPVRELAGWTVFCRSAADGSPLEWRIPGGGHPGPGGEIDGSADCLYFRRSDLMLLTD